MINLKKTCLVAAAGAMLFPAALYASQHGTAQDVVKDVRGNVIMNTHGNCVVTQWNAVTNECGMGGMRLSKEQRTVYFDFNKSTLNAKEKAKLDDLARIISGSKSVSSVDVVGYADQIGTNSYNKRLSTKRAQTVKSYLASKGLKTRNVRVEGMGEKGSVTHCADTLPRNELIACLAEDRRVEIELNLSK